ncbi:hypothetical protein LWI28_017541 [Acer negundo]|uniref:Uncharacterized protein n=1 Tax=Acer negundo TaxID=4023 RepID=A0AAD5NEZ5_ACENE|nr:hypothetical protein LWI28_017541 [Acer negundo]
MEGGYHALCWCDMKAKMLNYEDDSEKDDEDDEANGADERDNRQYNDVPLGGSNTLTPTDSSHFTSSSAASSSSSISKLRRPSIFSPSSVSILFPL